MASDIFADTSGFYALLVKKDYHHAAAGRILRDARRRNRRFVTTDYVLDETATLLKARGQGHLLPAFFERTLASAACRIEWTDPDGFLDVVSFFLKHSDHDWSFTDCVSFRTMKHWRLRDALTSDDHFVEAGFNVLLK